MENEFLRRDQERRQSPEAHTARVFVNAYGQSDSGSHRSSNEDQFLIAVLNRQLEVFQTSLGSDHGHDLDEPAEHGWVFLVADGIGGRLCGDEASALTAKASLSFLQSTMPWFATLEKDQLGHAEEVLATVVQNTHRAVLAVGNDKPPERTMASTLTLAYVLWPHLFVVHTGDSRCYLLRDGMMRRLTTGRTRAHELLGTDGGDHDRLDDVRSARHSHTRAAGAGRQLPPRPKVGRWELRDRDTLLLCSDGLTGPISDERIEEILNSETFANARCQALIEAAHAAGASDDTTVVVASFEDFESRPNDS